MSTSLDIPGATRHRLRVFEDERGWFRETFRQSWFPGARFVQSNASVSAANVLRGMHYHLHQDDYWVLLDGTVTVALADIRCSRRSPEHPHKRCAGVVTFQMVAGDGVYVPAGVAHGFYAHTNALLTYLVTSYYDPDDELGIAWNDPDVAIPWPCRAPILSQRDRGCPWLSDIPEERLPL